MLSAVMVPFMAFVVPGSIYGQSSFTDGRDIKVTIGLIARGSCLQIAVDQQIAT